MADTFKVDGADKVTGASKTKNTSFGWSDPSGELPLPEYHYEPSLNKAVTKIQHRKIVFENSKFIVFKI